MSSRSMKFMVRKIRSRTTSSASSPSPPNHSDLNSAVFQLSISPRTAETQALAWTSLAATCASASASTSAPAPPWAWIKDALPPPPPGPWIEMPPLAGKMRKRFATRSNTSAEEYGHPDRLYRPASLRLLPQDGQLPPQEGRLPYHHGSLPSAAECGCDPATSLRCKRAVPPLAATMLRWINAPGRRPTKGHQGQGHCALALRSNCAPASGNSASATALIAFTSVAGLTSTLQVMLPRKV
mmetsp:Transcript_16241/g.48286  ORF Transcript_16241/g.48286 Transcript_16241/m.48286 type:complete len:240 (-) Transcript_16241:355-1074(-)